MTPSPLASLTSHARRSMRTLRREGIAPTDTDALMRMDDDLEHTASTLIGDGMERSLVRAAIERGMARRPSSSATVLRRTYDPQDCTSVGWRYEWHAGRFMAERRTCWQGSRSGVRVLIRRCTLAEARASAAVFTRDDEDAMEPMYTVTCKGSIIR